MSLGGLEISGWTAVGEDPVTISGGEVPVPKASHRLTPGSAWVNHDKNFQIFNHSRDTWNIWKTPEGFGVKQVVPEEFLPMVNTIAEYKRIIADNFFWNLLPPLPLSPPFPSVFTDVNKKKQEIEAACEKAITDSLAIQQDNIKSIYEPEPDPKPSAWRATDATEIMSIEEMKQALKDGIVRFH